MKKHFVQMGMILFAAGAMFLTSCKKEVGEEENEEEVITTMRLTFMPTTGGSSMTYQFEDMDGPGGANPTVDPIVLQPNMGYNVSIQLLNKTTNPAEDITEEVNEEAEAHRFYFAPSAGSNITVTNLDNDPDGMPLGVTSTWNTGTAATGTIRVTLRHYAGNPPNKALSDLVNSSKSATDLEVDFTTRVQ